MEFSARDECDNEESTVRKHVIRCLVYAGAVVLCAGMTSCTSTTQYETQDIMGWSVEVNRDLLQDEELAAATLKELETQLFAISRDVPAKALEFLRTVRIWVDRDDGVTACMAYHPSSEWLRDHDRNPDMGKGVQVGNAVNFLEWCRADQPSMVLHELAHAYHHQFLGYDHEGVKQAYERAFNDGLYRSVLHIRGNTVDKHYALTSEVEFFAEMTEAYFGCNDIYPFVRGELQQYDRATFDLIKQLWGD
jgi:hypothetical protein